MTISPTGKFDYLVTQLRHMLPTMRFNAARALGELNDPRAIDILWAALNNDPSPAVRRAAKFALADLGVDIAEQGHTE